MAPLYMGFAVAIEGMGVNFSSAKTSKEAGAVKLKPSSDNLLLILVNFYVNFYIQSRP